MIKSIATVAAGLVAAAVMAAPAHADTTCPGAACTPVPTCPTALPCTPPPSVCPAALPCAHTHHARVIIFRHPALGVQVEGRWFVAQQPGRFA